MEFFVNIEQKFNYIKSSLPNTLYAPHLHPCYELYICFDHTPRFAILNGQKIAIDRPCVILYAPYSVHANIAEDPKIVYTRYSLYFGKEFMEKHHESICDLPMLQSKNSCVFLLTPQCEAELKAVINLLDVTPIRSCRQELLLVYLLRHLHHYNINNKMLPDDIIHIKSPSYIPDVIQYIVENINTPLKISDIASNFFVCSNKLNQDFKRFTGTAIHQFIIHVKISIAQYELKRSQCSVQEISKMMGFENEIYFFSFFKRNTGMTPLQWAKRNSSHSNGREMAKYMNHFNTT